MITTSTTRSNGARVAALCWLAVLLVAGHVADRVGARTAGITGPEGTTKARHLGRRNRAFGAHQKSGQPVSVLIRIRSTGSWPGAPGAAPPAVRPRRLSRRSSRPASLVRP